MIRKFYKYGFIKRMENKRNRKNKKLKKPFECVYGYEEMHEF